MPLTTSVQKGTTLYFLPDFDPVVVWDVIARERITNMMSVPLMLRASISGPAEREPRREKSTAKSAAKSAVVAALDDSAQTRFTALKAWRAEVAREHNLPAYVIFHDATLAAIAAIDPRSLGDLEGVSGIGAKKLEAYGEAVLGVCVAA